MRVLRLGFLAPIALAGCAQVFGLDETSGGSGTNYTHTFQRVSIGATIVKSPQPVAGQTADFLIPDAMDPSGYTRVPGTMTATNDGWTTRIDGDAVPLLEYTLPDDPQPIKRLDAFPNTTVLDAFPVLEHPSRVPPPDAATLMLQVGLPSPYAGESFTLLAVGPWSARALPGTELPGPAATQLGPVTIPYDPANFTQLAGRPMLDSITPNDVVVLLRYAGADLTGVFQQPSFTQTGSDPIDGTMINNAHSTLDFTVQPMTPPMRFSGVRPATGSVAMSWGLYAAPGAAYAQLAGVQLQAAGVGAADSGMISASYGNPFVANGWSTALQWSTSATRAYTDPVTMLPITLATGLQQIVEPSGGMTLDLPAALPISVSLNQQALISDGMTVSLDPAKAADIAATFDRSACAFYEADIVDHVPDTAMPPTRLDAVTRYRVRMTTTSIKLPGGVFEADHLYSIRFYCVNGGYPSFADGDLQNRALPYSIGYLDSGVFKVAMP